MKKLFALMMSAVLCLSLLAACSPKAPGEGGNDEQTPIDLGAFAQTLMDNHEIAGFVEKVDPTDEEFGATMLENSYPGLKDLDLEQSEIYLCMVSFSTGEFALVQAKNADDATKVQEIFQARIDNMTAEGMNYPETIELWSKSAQVVTNGNYVMLICHEDCEAIVSEFNALFQG